MSERPFMQLYVSDYIGDTLHLSTEQHGAYLLILMAMWNADGKLPDDDTKLARISRLSVKKWRGIKDDIEALFRVDDGVWTNGRLTKELQKSKSKSESRASAGAKGGAAKALKNNKPCVANANGLLKHLPETIKSLKKEEGKKGNPIVSWDQVSPNDPVLNRPDDPLAEYSENEMANLTITFDLLDVESEISDLVDWCYQKKITKSNERKKAIYSALRKKQQALEASRDLIEGKESGPAVSVSSEAWAAMDRKHGRALKGYRPK